MSPLTESQEPSNSCSSGFNIISKKECNEVPEQPSHSISSLQVENKNKTCSKLIAHFLVNIVCKSIVAKKRSLVCR